MMNLTILSVIVFVIFHVAECAVNTGILPPKDGLEIFSPTKTTESEILTLTNSTEPIANVTSSIAMLHGQKQIKEVRQQSSDTVTSAPNHFSRENVEGMETAIQNAKAQGWDIGIATMANQFRGYDNQDNFLFRLYNTTSPATHAQDDSRAVNDTEDAGPKVTPTIGLFGILDGHGESGGAISNEAAKIVQIEADKFFTNFTASSLQGYATTPQEAIILSLVTNNADHAIDARGSALKAALHILYHRAHEAVKTILHGGSTTSLVLIDVITEKVYVASAGDSIVLGVADRKLYKISAIHSASEKHERERLVHAFTRSNMGPFKSVSSNFDSSHIAIGFLSFGNDDWFEVSEGKEFEEEKKNEEKDDDDDDNKLENQNMSLDGNRSLFRTAFQNEQRAISAHYDELHDKLAGTGASQLPDILVDGVNSGDTTSSSSSTTTTSSSSSITTTSLSSSTTTTSSSSSTTTTSSSSLTSSGLEETITTTITTTTTVKMTDLMTPEFSTNTTTTTATVHPYLLEPISPISISELYFSLPMLPDGTRAFPDQFPTIAYLKYEMFLFEHPTWDFRLENLQPTRSLGDMDLADIVIRTSGWVRHDPEIKEYDLKDFDYLVMTTDGFTNNYEIPAFMNVMTDRVLNCTETEKCLENPVPYFERWMANADAIFDAQFDESISAIDGEAGSRAAVEMSAVLSSALAEFPTDRSKAMQKAISSARMHNIDDDITVMYISFKKP